MIMWDQHSPQEIRDALVNVLNKVINTEVVPAVSAKSAETTKIILYLQRKNTQNRLRPRN